MAEADDREWKVGALAAASGVTVRALQHYDGLGLLVPSQRSSARHRLYSEDDVQRLYRIVALRQLGLGLRDIVAVLDGKEGVLAGVVRRHLERVERDLERQRRLRDRLAGLLRTLEQSREPSAGQFIETMEAMMVTGDVVEIARVLGVSRQRASAVVSEPDFPAPAAEHVGRAVWARRRVVAWAAHHPQRGARWRRPAAAGSGLASSAAFMAALGRQSDELHYGWIGDEHLLLALLDPDCPGAAGSVLTTFGLSAPALRSTIIERLGPPPVTADKGAMLHPTTGYVLQRAGLKAVELRDEQVGSEHALLALIEASPDSGALAVLRAAGVDPPAVADRVLAFTDSARGDLGAGGDATEVCREVHAADVARILGISRDRVVQLVAVAADFPPSRTSPAGYRVWPRSEIETWAEAHPEHEAASRRLDPPRPGSVGPGSDRILDLATAEARTLNHAWVGDEHFLLALLHPDCPGDAHAVLCAEGLTLDDVRRHYVESMGDPFESDRDDPVLSARTHELLERATLTALESEDEQVSGEHLLLALLHAWPRLRPLTDISGTALHERLMQHTDGMLPAQPITPRPPSWLSPVRAPRPEPLQLASSPAGHEPRQRRPWGSRVFEIPGRPWSPANGQYYVDRDGHAILTSDGQPVHSLRDEQGNLVLDEHGDVILTAVPVPAGSHIRLHPDDE